MGSDNCPENFENITIKQETTDILARNSSRSSDVLPLINAKNKTETKKNVDRIISLTEVCVLSLER